MNLPSCLTNFIIHIKFELLLRLRSCVKVCKNRKKEMIKRIKSIKNFGVFNKYQTDSSVSEFNKYNLIYGWNASGKTTLSRLFRCFELQAMHGDFSQATFQLHTDNGIMSNENLDQHISIRVFNKDFIDENVFTQEDTIQPIYYLGKEDIEQKKKLKILKNEGREKTAQLTSKKENLENKKKAKEKFITDKAKEIKQFLRTEGTDNYTNYDKSHFSRNIKTLNQEGINQNILGEEVLSQKKKSINQTVKDNIQSLEKQSYFMEKDIKVVNEVLEKEVISETIEKLKNNKTLNQWIRAGLNLYNKSGESICDFCEQPMPEKRIKALKKHFSQDYQSLISKLEDLKQNWELKKLQTPTLNKDSLYDDLSLNFKTEKNKLDEEIKKYNQSIETVLEQLKKKKENPFKIPEEINYEIFQIEDLIDKVNEIISQHNKKTDTFKETRLKEKKDIEKHFLSESYEEYQTLKSEISDLVKSVKKLEDENSKIEAEIKQLSQNRRDYKITAQEINKTLKSFLGREELIFEATNTENEGYYIKRTSNDKFAKSLSEGEKTAVALIYFLSKLKEENFDLTNGIVVIDDPISSLDSNSVFQAFGFIKSGVKQAKQIFILTHNFDFFKHIKHWFKRDYREKSEFFMIKNFFIEQNKRTAKLSSLDDLLKDYDSEYQYLFSLLYRLKTDEGNALKEIYPLPNVARKFMETFLSFKFPSEKNHDAFFSKAREEADFDSGKIEKIKRFINAHSHSNMDKMTSWDISQWSEGKQVIEDILELVKRLDEGHYKGLCVLVKI